MRAGGRPQESWQRRFTASPVLGGVVLKQSGVKAGVSAYRSFWDGAIPTGSIIQTQTRLSELAFLCSKV